MQFMDGIKDSPYAALVKHTSFDQAGPTHALYVGGKKIAEGVPTDLNVKFDQEVASHSGSVEIKRLYLGETTVIRSRRFQRSR